MAELICSLRLVNLCYLFSKRPFLNFLESGGFSKEDVLLQEPKAGVSKHYNILDKCILVLLFIILFNKMFRKDS